MVKQPSFKNLTNKNYGRPNLSQNMTMQGFTRPHIDSFNYFLRDGLIKIATSINPVEFKLGDDLVSLYLTDAIIYPPLAPPGTQCKNMKVYPSECRLRGSSYTGKLHIYLNWKINNRLKYGPEEFAIGKVPIMVKSAACNLAPLNPKELVEKCEEEEEMGGYYIINGIEKVTRMLIMQRRNYPIVIKRNGWKKRGVNFTEYGCQLRSVTADETSCTSVLHYVNNGSCVLCFNYFKEMFFIPLSMLLKVLCDNTDNYIFQELMHSKEDDSFYKGCITNMLRAVHEEGLFTREQILTYIGDRFRAKVKLEQHYTPLAIGEYIINECIIPHLSDYQDKFNLLVYMTQKLFSASSGKCCIEEVDNPVFQEALTSGNLYQMVLKEKIEGWLVGLKMRLQIDYKRDRTLVINSAAIASACKHVMDVTKSMDYTMATGNVITKSGLGLMQYSGLAIVADKLNILRYISHFRCIHRGAFFAEMRTTAVRRLLPEAWGFLCPVHTPDGTPCGLMNHLSAECCIVNSIPYTLVAGLPILLGELGMKDYSMPSKSTDYCVLLDGRLVGRIEVVQLDSFVQQLRQFKVEGIKVPRYLEIVAVKRTKYNSQYPGIYLFTSVSRMMRPVRNIACDQVEMIGTFEQAYLNVCVTILEAYPDLTTHEELTEQSLLSVVGSMTPFSDFNQSPRNMYQCQMGKQTMGVPCHALTGRSDNKLYSLNTPQSPIVRPVIYDDYDIDNYPLGTNAVVAVISYTGYDMEDAMILNKSAYERGFAYGSIYKSEFIDLKEKNREHTSKILHKFGVKEGHSGTLNEDGLPPVGLYVQKGNNLYSYYNVQTGVYRIQTYSLMEPAYIHAVKLLGSEDGNQVLQRIAIVYRIERNPIIGDKFSSRHGQKGICSQRWRVEDMPFTESGMQPDIIFNPHGFPSRMTIGMMIESMAGKSAAMHGICHDATPFTFSEDQSAVEYFGDMLTSAGYNYYGSERMYSGVDGRELKADIFMGIVYYQRLRHMVSDKFQVRATGGYDLLTHQPVKGRKRGGGVRFGEMERDAMIAHGTSFLLQDRLLNCSDVSEAKVCTKCGSMLSSYMAKTSEVGIENQADVSVDHEGHWMCRLCFSVNTVKSVNVPYVFKYLIAELAAINVKVFIELK